MKHTNTQNQLDCIHQEKNSILIKLSSYWNVVGNNKSNQSKRVKVLCPHAKVPDRHFMINCKEPGRNKVKEWCLKRNCVRLFFARLDRNWIVPTCGLISAQLQPTSLLCVSNVIKCIFNERSWFQSFRIIARSLL